MKIFHYKTTPVFFLIWFAAVWLLHRDVVSQSFLSKGAHIDIVDGALVMRQDFMGMYLGNQKVGYRRFVLKEDRNDDAVSTAGKYFIFHSDMVMRIQALGMPIEMVVSQSGEVNEDLTLRSFRFQYNASGQETYLMGTVEQGGIQLVSRSEGYSATKTIPVNTSIYQSDMLPLLLAQEGLEVDMKRAYPVFEPLLSLVGTVHIEVEGKEIITLPSGEKVDTFRTNAEFQGVHTLFWIDGKGEVYKELSEVAGMRFASMRETQEEAMDLSFVSKEINDTPDPAGDQQDLGDASKVVPNVVLADPSAVKSMKIKLSGAAKENIWLDDEKQVLTNEEDGALIIDVTKMDYATIAGSLPEETPPYKNDDPAMAEYLGDDLYIQTRHPLIQAKAMEIAKDAANEWDATKKVADWLYRAIQKEIRGTIPSAIEVLNSMRGDCNEHSTLFTAMMRSIGVPTKIISGLVYQDDGFYYHAWNEVYINGKWLPIDTTLYRIEMDAAHIKLAEGALDQQANIAMLIGKLQIEILDYS